jgi:predicted acyl esterase
MNQWQVAALQPPHLAAMVAWEGAADFYRDVSYHGGILCDFLGKWYGKQVASVQHGLGERALKSQTTGASVAGSASLSTEELARNRSDLGREVEAHPLDDEWHRSRSPDWSKVKTPFLSAANWGGQGLHPRGNFEAFTQAAAEQKWLEVHGLEHWTHFYTDYGVALQRRFFDHFLKGADNGWDPQPRVRLQIRHVDGRFVERHEGEWPLARTRWTRYYLNPESGSLDPHAMPQESAIPYDALGEGLTFSTTPLEKELEITGPIAAKLFVSSTTWDADLFLVVRVFGPRGDEVVFQGALDPNTPIAQGWLRASHRKLDARRSLPYRPYHPHDERQPLKAGEIYELDVEVWPTCIVVPPGYRVALSVRGRDYEYAGALSDFARSFHYASKGVGPFTHTDPDDRPPEVFGGRVTVHAGGRHPSYLLLPVIPS